MKRIEPTPGYAPLVIVAHGPVQGLDVAVGELVLEFQIVLWGNLEFLFIVLLFQTNGAAELQLALLLVELLLLALLKHLHLVFHFVHELVLETFFLLGSVHLLLQ